YCLLENGAENLATHACCASLLVRHQSLVGGNDHHAQAATIVRHFFLAFVYTQSWSAVALDLFDNGFALIVFEIYRQNGFATFFSNRETVDVTFVLQHFADGYLDLGRRTHNLRQLGHLGISDAGQQICNRVRHTHNFRSSLPACLCQSGHITTHRCFAKLVTAHAKLAVHPVWATSDSATILLTNRTGIAWQLLQLNLCFPRVVIARIDIPQDCLEGRALGRKCSHSLGAFFFTSQNRCFRHA